MLPKYAHTHTHIYIILIVIHNRLKFTSQLISPRG